MADIKNPIVSSILQELSDIKSLMKSGKSFDSLETHWKALVVIGIIFMILVLGLVIFIILIFKTDLISLDFIIDSKNNDNHSFDQI